MTTSFEQAEQPRNDEHQDSQKPEKGLSQVRYIKYPLQLIAYLGGVLLIYVMGPAVLNANERIPLVVFHACVTVVCLVILMVAHRLMEKAADKYADLLIDVAKRRKEAIEAHKRNREAFRDRYYPLADLILGSLPYIEPGKAMKDILKQTSKVSPPWPEHEVRIIIGILMSNNLVVHASGDADRYKRKQDTVDSALDALVAGN